MSITVDKTVKGTLALRISNLTTFMKKNGQRSESPPQQVAGLGWRIWARPAFGGTYYLECCLTGVNAFKWELLGASNDFVVNDAVEIRMDFLVSDVCGASFDTLEIVGALGTDIELVVGDSVFCANKGYLSVVSAVFRDLFGLTEASEGEKEMEQIELKDLDASEFRVFLAVVYPTRYPINDANVLSVFRIADRLDVQHVLTECETHLTGVNRVPWFEKLKLAADLRRDGLRKQLIETMTCDDIKTIKLGENKDQLGEDVLRAMFEKCFSIHHP